jgi:hypothetical protein
VNMTVSGCAGCTVLDRPEIEAVVQGDVA